MVDRLILVEMLSLSLKNEFDWKVLSPKSQNNMESRHPRAIDLNHTKLNKAIHESLQIKVYRFHLVCAFIYLLIKIHHQIINKSESQSSTTFHQINK